MLPVEQWDEVITQAAPSFTRTGDDATHARDLLWAETLAAGIDWPTAATAETVTPAQAEASQAKLDALQAALVRSQNLRHAHSNLEGLRAVVGRLSDQSRQRPYGLDMRSSQQTIQDGLQR